MGARSQPLKGASGQIQLGDTPRVAARFLKFNVKFESRKIKMIAWQHSQKNSMENINRWPQWTLMWHLI